MIINEELQNVRLSQILKDALIKATDTYSTPPQIIWIDNSTIATLGNFSASTGKAKAKKTFKILRHSVKQSSSLYLVKVSLFTVCSFQFFLSLQDNLSDLSFVKD